MNHTPLAEQAFRYVAGELADAELAEFERQLDDDQATREAVAAALEWTQAVWLAEQEVPSPRDEASVDSNTATPAMSRAAIAPPTNHPRSPVTVALATAGLLLLALSVVPLLRTTDRRLSSHVVPGSPEQQLALAWNQVRQDSPTLATGTDDRLEANDEDTDGDTDLTGTSNDPAQQDDELASPPSWIMAAVSAGTEQPNGSAAPPTPAGPDHEDL